MRFGRSSHSAGKCESQAAEGLWGTIFGDAINRDPILDWLFHHSTTINIRGESIS